MPRLCRQGTRLSIPVHPVRHHADSERYHHPDRDRRRTRRCTRPSNLNGRVYNCQRDHHRHPELSTNPTDSDHPYDPVLESSRRGPDRAEDREPGLPIPPDGTAPLTGPLATASSTAGSDDFAIPAWGVPPTASCPDPGIQNSLDDPAGGYDTKNVGLYQDQTTPAGRPGWSQFAVTTTVVTLGFPVGPPPGFNF